MLLHIFSDLNLHYLDKAEDQQIINPNTEYVVITGNTSSENKRALLFAEQLALKYPKTNIIFNYGIFELKNKLHTAVEDGYNTRINIFKQSPKNVFYPKGSIVGNFDIYCTIGWPLYHSLDDFNSSILVDSTVISFSESLYIGDVCVTEKYRKVFNMDFVKMMAEKESVLLNEWINNDKGKPKILVTAIGSNSGSVLKNINYSIFNNLNLNNLLWISGGDMLKVSKNQLCSPRKERIHFYDIANFFE